MSAARTEADRLPVMRFVPLLLLLLCAPISWAEDDPDKPRVLPRGTLKLVRSGTLDTLDPAKAALELERQAVGNIYDQLFEHDHEKRPYELRPAVAAALPEISEDGLVQTIRLRKDIRYVDDRCFEGGRGRAVTARDVRFVILRMMDSQVKSPGQWMLARRIVGLDDFVKASAKIAANPKRFAYRTTEGYPAVEGLDVVDDHTLRIRLLKPMPELAWLLASAWLSIYPPEAVKAYGAGLGRRVVGTGPFKLVIFQPGRSLVVRRNTEFRDPARPRVERVELTVAETPLKAWAAFTRGESAWNEVARDAFTAAVDPHTGKLVPHLAKAGITLHRDPRLEIFYDAFNWEDPVVGGKAGEKGRAIRYAISLASDEVYAMTRLYTYRAERVYGPILPELNAYDRTRKNDSMRAPDETEAEALESARELLAEVGYDEKNPVPTIHMHILSDKTSGYVFDVLKRQVARVGIRLEPIRVTWPNMQAALKAKKAQMWSSSWYADLPDAQNFLQLFYGPNSPEPNYSNYKNDEVDELYEEARALPPGDERDDVLSQMEALVLEDAPWRFRFRRIRWTAIQPWLVGYRHNGVAPKTWSHVAIDPARRPK